MTRVPQVDIMSSAGLEDAKCSPRKGLGHEDEPDKVLHVIMLKFPIFTLWCRGINQDPLKSRDISMGRITSRANSAKKEFMAS